MPDDIVGTPYDNEKFQEGVLYEGNQPIVGKLFFRYNVYEEKIELKKTFTDDDRDISILKKSPEIVIKIKNGYLTYDENSKSYYQILFVGDNYKLYKKSHKTFYKAKRAKNSFDRNVLATFKDKCFYFLVDKKGEFHEIPSSQKQRIKLFGNKKDEIKKYLKKYDLDITEEEILIKIVRYFNSIKGATL